MNYEGGGESFEEAERGWDLKEVRFVIVLLDEILLLGGAGGDIYDYVTGWCC